MYLASYPSQSSPTVFTDEPKKKEGEALLGRCDSFVVETNVHYRVTRQTGSHIRLTCESSKQHHFRYRRIPSHIFCSRVADTGILK